MKKKNGFIRFILSFLPGAGEMYMGFMKMGVSLMSAFFLLAAVSGFLGFGLLMFADIIIWFYSFFHVHNLADLPDEEFYALEDDYLIHPDQILSKGKDCSESETGRKAVSVSLIVLGAILIYQGIRHVLYAYLPEPIVWILSQISYCLPKIVVGAAIICLGMHMIAGKKQQLKEEKENRDRS
ncbi:MAG: hypothetical protein ACI4DV_04570 [Lachnospiraceae bacterium]